MGIHARVRNTKKSLKDRSLNKWHRAKKAEKKKRMPPEVVNIEDAYLFSVDKMKNKLRNPRNNIAISGKNRQRLMKRLRHSLRDKSAIEVEATPGKSFKSKSQSDDFNDEEMQETEGVTELEQKSADTTASTSAASSSKKKKRGRGKGKKVTATNEDVDMEGD